LFGALGVLDCGVPDCGVFVCGFAGITGAGFENFSNTDPPCSTPLSERSTRANAHTMNIMAHHVVARESTVAAPRGPKAVWLPAPPKAPAMSAALPLCSSTTMIRNRQFTTKKVGRTQENQRESESLQPKAINANPATNEIAHLAFHNLAQNKDAAAGSWQTISPIHSRLQSTQMILRPGSRPRPARHPTLLAPSNPECCRV
jgi:hypothetical protein